MDIDVGSSGSGHVTITFGNSGSAAVTVTIDVEPGAGGHRRGVVDGTTVKTIEITGSTGA